MVDNGAAIHIENLNTSDAQVIDLVGVNKIVLDLGCWTGATARALVARGCRVTGVAADADAAVLVRQDVHEVVVVDLNKHALLDRFDEASFDVVISGVVDHMIDPVEVLRMAARLLTPRGRLVLSVPNVTHGSVRLALLQGRWSSRSTGRQGRTHRRSLSRSDVAEMVAAAGLVIEDLRATLEDPLRSEVDVDTTSLPDGIIEWVRDQPDAFVDHFAVSVRAPDVNEEAVVSDKALRLPVDLETVRLRDEHTASADRDLLRRRELLTVRDHVLGLEVSTTAAEDRATKAVVRARRLRERLDAVKKQNDRLREQVAQMEDRLTAAEASSGPRRIVRSLRRRIGGG